MSAQAHLKLGFAIVCIAGLIFAYFFTDAGVAVRPSYAVTKPEVEAARIIALENEIVELRDQLQCLEDANLIKAVSKREAVGKGGETPGVLEVQELAQILERLRAVESSIADVQDFQKRVSSLGSNVGEFGIDPDNQSFVISMGGRRNLAPGELLDYQSQAINPLASESEKLSALRSLRGNQDEFGDARNRDVVLSMIDLVETSDDAEVRADVYRQLSGVTEPDLKRPLLNSLANDPNAEVREEAAETLEDFLPDSEVLAALQYAAQNDESKDVREQASESMD